MNFVFLLIYKPVKTLGFIESIYLMIGLRKRLGDGKSADSSAVYH